MHCFLTTSLSTTLHSLRKSTGTVNLYASVLYTSAFKLAKSGFVARLDVSTAVAPFKPAFVA